MNAWISDNQPVSQPYPLVIDSVFAGWALGTRNVVRSRRFTKSVLFSEPYRQGVDYIGTSAELSPGESVTFSRWTTDRDVPFTERCADGSPDFAAHAAARVKAGFAPTPSAELDDRDHYGNPFEEADRQPYGERGVLGTGQL